jgi:hypothetical protein
MEADDEALKAIREQDQEWLTSQRAELWRVAQKGYAEEGRGALLVVFGESTPGLTVVGYTTEPNAEVQGIAKRLASYNPATQMVVICMGQLCHRGSAGAARVSGAVPHTGGVDFVCDK